MPAYPNSCLDFPFFASIVQSDVQLELNIRVQGAN